MPVIAISTTACNIAYTFYVNATYSAVSGSADGTREASAVTNAEQHAWVDLVHAPVMVVDREGARVVRANAQAVGLVGDSLDGRDLVDLFGAYAAGRLQAVLGGGSHDPEEVVLYCRTPFGLATIGFKPSWLPGDAGAVVTLRDPRGPSAVGRGSAAPPAADFGPMLEEIVRSLPVGVEIYDGNLRELFFNNLSDQMFGVGTTAHGPVQGDLDGWWERAFPDDAARARAIQGWRECLDGARADPSTVKEAEWEVLCRDGQTRTVQFRFRFVGDTYIVVFWDVSEQRRLEHELRHLAVTDELTGLCNRRHFFDEGDRAFRLAVATCSELAVLMIDLDHFKSINDGHGHGAGDAVLREVARRCRGTLRARDLVARVGGEEFAVLLPTTDMAGARHVAQNLVACLSGQPVEIETGALDVRASIGVAVLLPGDRSIEAVIERADRALYAAKDGGRNQVVVFPPSASTADGDGAMLYE